MIKKKIDLGEYIITIYHDEKTGKLDVNVLDELGDVIESINIMNDYDEDDEDQIGIDFNLN